MNKRNREERLLVVLDISKRLRNFPKSTYNINENPYMDLYNTDYLAIKKIKEIFKEYVNQDEILSQSMSGSIKFPEIQRKIEYILPINKRNEPVFVMKSYL